MPLLFQPLVARWLVTAALALFSLLLCFRLQKSGVRGWLLMTSLLPVSWGIVLAKAGYELLRFQESFPFTWCYTTGLLGMLIGLWLTARLCRQAVVPLMDTMSPWLCLTMALVRLAQRWLGEIGTGIYLEEDSLFCHGPLFMLNEWEEPLLAVFLLEHFCALLAMILSLLSRKSRPDAAGVTLGRSVALLLLPQILLEQLRTGHFLRWRMLRLEQVLCALIVLALLLFLCGALRRNTRASGLRCFWPVLPYLLAVALIAVVQFSLDGKLVELSVTVCWVLYVLALLIMLCMTGFAAHRLNAGTKSPQGE